MDGKSYIHKFLSFLSYSKPKKDILTCIKDNKDIKDIHIHVREPWTTPESLLESSESNDSEIREGYWHI
jgi:hypothetical protein